jgi:hypothetical protein
LFVLLITHDKSMAEWKITKGKIMGEWKMTKGQTMAEWKMSKGQTMAEWKMTKGLRKDGCLSFRHFSFGHWLVCSSDNPCWYLPSFLSYFVIFSFGHCCEWKMTKGQTMAEWKMTKGQTMAE